MSNNKGPHLETLIQKARVSCFTIPWKDHLKPDDYISLKFFQHKNINMS